MRNIVIIGNGISGVTCARHIRKACNDKLTIISAESDHFFSRTALMYIFMGHMKYEHTKPYEDFFWEKNRIALVRNYVISIDADNKKIAFADGNEMFYDILIIATGSVTQKFDWPGQHLNGVQGLYNLQDLESMERRTSNVRSAVIVGGGLIGVEMAEMLHSKKIKVILLVKDRYYWAGTLPEQDGILINNHIERHGIEVRYETTLKEITGDEEKGVVQVTTSTGEIIPCQFVGIATGVKPNIQFLQSSKLELGKGILINEYFETNLPDVYAIGDCAEFRKPPEKRKTIEQVWYTGRMHGETLAQTICGRKTAYMPGPWFNSAKFFDLEYQTYGLVPSVCAENERYFFWQHPKKEIALGLLYQSRDNILLGVNCYGLRLRHACFDRWLSEKRRIDFVLSHLHEAMFNPEFTKDHTSEIIANFNLQTDGLVKIKRSATSFFKAQTR